MFYIRKNKNYPKNQFLQELFCSSFYQSYFQRTFEHRIDRSKAFYIRQIILSVLPLPTSRL